MTLAILEADGVQPSRRDRFVHLARAKLAHHRDEIVAALQVGVLAAVAIGVAVTPAAVKAPARPATFFPTSITPEALSGPQPGVADNVDSKRMLQDLMTKAGLRPDFGLRHLSWDQARRLNALMPPVHAPLGAAQPFAISLKTGNGKEALRCLTQAAYYEAGANGSDAEAAVAPVVLNRGRHPDFPKSVCGVVYQGSARDTGCQFTFTCDGALARPVDKAAWSQAGKVAARALSGYVVKIVGPSTYYHADYVFPAWAPTLAKVTQVGPHIFYSATGSQGPVLTGRYSGGEMKLAKDILNAAARFIGKPTPAAEAPVQLAQASTTSTPAGLRVQADRLQRVHEAFAAASGPETKPAQPVADASAAPPVQTADAQSPAA